MKLKKKYKHKANKPESLTKNFSLNRNKEIVEQIKAVAIPLCEAYGIEVAHIEYHREPAGRILRLYIDKPGGINLYDCTVISRELSDLLDINLEIAERYSLEVSSPGPNRPLGKELDFERFKGNIAKIKISEPVCGKIMQEGVLQGISEGIVKLMVNDKIIEIPFHKIIGARLVNYSGENIC